jgi:5-(carboxyamino)imidazole ribonucleotide synthase
MSSINFFPRVDILATQQFALFFREAATALGVEINQLDQKLATSELCQRAVGCTVLTFLDVLPTLNQINSIERESIKCVPGAKVLNAIADHISRVDLKESDTGARLEVMVARSAHGQIASWTPFSITEVSGQQITVVPAPELSESALELAQNYAIKIASEIGLIGVLNVGIELLDGQPTLINLEYGPRRFGLWTSFGALTSQFEQHLRAILDLPLGDTSLRAKWTVTGDIHVGSKQDMYRPYLHLMARTPAMKFWQGADHSFMSISGADLNFLLHEVKHAYLYFKGEIDE